MYLSIPKYLISFSINSVVWCIIEYNLFYIKELYHFTTGKDLFLPYPVPVVYGMFVKM